MGELNRDSHIKSTPCDIILIGLTPPHYACEYIYIMLCILMKISKSFSWFVTALELYILVCFCFHKLSCNIQDKGELRMVPICGCLRSKPFYGTANLVLIPFQRMSSATCEPRTAQKDDGFKFLFVAVKSQPSWVSHVAQFAIVHAYLRI